MVVGIDPSQPAARFSCGREIFSQITGGEGNLTFLQMQMETRASAARHKLSISDAEVRIYGLWFNPLVAHNDKIRRLQAQFDAVDEDGVRLIARKLSSLVNVYQLFELVSRMAISVCPSITLYVI